MGRRELSDMLTYLRRFSARALRRVARACDVPTPGLPQWTQLPFSTETQALYGSVKSRTMTSIERVDALREAIEYAHANSIAGDIVECGVWRGGSMMAAAMTLLRLGSLRRIWMYDTFTGMTSPGPDVTDFQGRPA